MDLLLILSLGFAPGLFWLWYFYRKDRWEPEPKHLIIRTFFLGILVAVPVSLLESPFEGSYFLAAVIVAPVIEEVAKYFVVRKTLYHHDEFDEPIDGIIYASAVALGFASIENVAYLAQAYFDHGALGEIFFLRALLSVPGHVLFSSMWGYALGRAKFSEPSLRQKLVTNGLLLAIIAHAVFNFLALTGLMWALGIFVFIPLLWKRFNRNIQRSLARSPYGMPGRRGSHGLEQKARQFFEHGSTPAQPSRLPPIPIPSESQQLSSIELAGLPTQEAGDDNLSETYVLPSEIDCPVCGSHLSLSKYERVKGVFICPLCKKTYEKNALGQTRFVLPPVVICPVCDTQVELDNTERAQGSFRCPDCGEEIEHVDDE